MEFYLNNHFQVWITMEKRKESMEKCLYFHTIGLVCFLKWIIQNFWKWIHLKSRVFFSRCLEQVASIVTVNVYRVWESMGRASLMLRQEVWCATERTLLHRALLFKKQWQHKLTQKKEKVKHNTWFPVWSSTVHYFSAMLDAWL